MPLNRSDRNLDLSRFDVGGLQNARTSDQLSAYLFSDRGIYRPGETVHLSALIRDLQSRAVKDRKGVLVIKRPSGVEFKRVAFDRAPTGAVTADIILPKSAPRGRWKATL